jgi:hypothetical protein
MRANLDPMMKHWLFAGLLLFVVAPALSEPGTEASSPTLEQGEVLLTGKAADIEAARTQLASRGFALREVARRDGEVTFAVKSLQGSYEAVGALFEDVMCGRLGNLRLSNLGFVGNEMDGNAKQRPTKYVLYGSPPTVRRIAEEAGRRGWSVAPVVPSGDGRSFTTLASGPSMTQRQFVAFLDTLFRWKIGDASMAPVENGKLFPSYEDD